MREILFRGKLTANGKWSEGNLVVNKRGVCVITPDETPIGTYGQVDPETVGQYTGLTDKNGKKIFEGDILSERPLMNSVAYVGCVKYSDENSAFEIVFDTGSSFVLGSYSKSYTVIGNIHDNPELLKGGVDNG